MTRQRWRVSTQNRRLAGVFSIAFAGYTESPETWIPARIPVDSAVCMVNGDATRPELTRDYTVY